MKDKPWLEMYDRGVPKTIDYPNCTLQQFLRDAALKYPQQACTVFRDVPLTYHEMNSLTDRMAGYFKHCGLTKGDRVGIWLPNIPQFVIAFYAILKAGGIVVAINPQYKAPEIEYQIKDSGLAWIITLEDLYPVLLPVAIKYNVKVITTTYEQAALIPGWVNQDQETERAYQDRVDLKSVLSKAYENTLQENSEPGDAAIFQYTGGTTGIPKAAIGLHRNLVANTLMFSHWLVGLEAGKEVVLAAIPLYHVYGMVIAMSMGILLGASIVLVDNPRNLDDLLSSIIRHKATLFPGVPNLYNAINNHAAVLEGKYILNSIKACISGAAPLMQHTKERFETLTGGKLMEGYGLSEAPTATHCNPMLGNNRVGSIGLPLPDVDCRIVDLESGETELPTGEQGELIIRSPQVMSAYHNMPDETKFALRDGWLFTGDIARMDEDGYFYLVDRKKDLIKIGGLQVWPREVEEVIDSHPAVIECAVAGVPDDQYGESVKAWVVLKPEVEVLASEIQDFCEQNLAHFKVPVLVEFCTALPRSTVGKVLRRELVRQHIEQK